MPSLRHARVIRCAVLQSIRLDESRYTFPAALLCSSFRGTFSSWTSTDSVHFDDCNWQQAPPKAAGAECHTDSSAVARNLAIADVIAVFSGATLAAPSREDCNSLQEGRHFARRLHRHKEEPPPAPRSTVSTTQTNSTELGIAWSTEANQDGRAHQSSSTNPSKDAVSNRHSTTAVESSVPADSAAQAYCR